MSPPWSPIGETTPSTTSSTRCGSSDGVAVLDLVEQADDQVDRLDLVQRADRLALAARRADVVVHECFCHDRPDLVTHWSLSPIVTLLLSRSSRSGVAGSRATGGGMEERVEALRELLTLDELTERVGMSVRNVRFYTTKGLVPPPIRRGRSRLLHRRPRRPARAGAGAAEPRLHALGDREVRRRHPRRRHPRGHRPAPHDARAVAGRAADRDVPRRARQARRPHAQPTTT